MTTWGIAGRIGLYHFGVVSAAWLLDGIRNWGSCIPSVTSYLLEVIERPGLELADVLRLGLGDPSRAAVFEVLRILAIFAVNSVIYAAIGAVILWALGTTRRKNSKVQVPDAT
jgi:hypothetical protein